MSLPIESSPAQDARAASPTRLRVFVNRLIFRSMLFVSGGIAIALYRLSKPLTWRFAKLQARNLIRFCGVRVRVRGLERLGAGPYIFTPNHQSHFDIAALLGYLPGCNRFAAKREMFAEPVLGAVLRTMGMIPVDRADPLASIERLNRLKLDGFSVVIFPEGTRSADGQLLPFKKGPFVAAISLGVPIVPVACKGTMQIMPKGEYLSILPGEAEMVVLDPIPTAGLSYDDRDRLLETVRERIAAELGR
jgi:1-acyl-sn-glycerol-3-phosphate acyltransferase